MPGGRKGRRKPGHGEGDNEAARDGQNAMAAQSGREKAPETGDIEAEQWLNPFRIGRPVTPVISHRRGADALPGSQLPRRPARGEPIRAVPVEAVPAEDEPVQGVPVQIWHEPPPEEVWQSGQQPPAEPVRGDGGDLHGRPWAAGGEADRYSPGGSAVPGGDHGAQAYYMEVPAPGPGAYPPGGYDGGLRSPPDERGGSVKYGTPREYGPPRSYRGGGESYPHGGHDRDAGHPGYQWSDSADGYDPGGGYARPESYSGYPPAAYGAPGRYASPRYGQPGDHGAPGDYRPPGDYDAPGDYRPPGDHGSPGSDGRRARPGRRSGAWRDPGQGG
jgi:hypothetical protein